MPDGKGGDDLGVFEDLLKKKEQAKGPAASEPVDDGGWDDDVAVAPAEPTVVAEPLAAKDVDASAADSTAAAIPAPVPAPPSWGEDLVPVVPRPPPPSSRLPPPPSRLSSVPKLAPPPTVGSDGPNLSSLAPGSLAPPVLTGSAFTSPLSAAHPLPPPPIPPPPRTSVAARVTERAIASDVVQPVAPRPFASKQAIVIAATLAAGIAVGFLVRGSGGATAANSTATLKAAAGQPGVKLLIDGREVGLLPHDVSGLTPGEHLVALEGDRYASTKKVLIFGPSEVKELEPEHLKVVRGAATFDVKTPGASLVLVTPDERRELSDYSLPVDIDATKSWTLEASKSGYETLRMPVTFEDQPNKTFAVALAESQKHDNAAAAAPTPAEAEKAAHKASSPVAPKAEPAKAQPPAGTCKLNVNSIPVSKILLDGRPIGLTPKVGIVVPAGSHTVVFVGEKGRKSTSSSCQPGETKAVSMHL